MENEKEKRMMPYMKAVRATEITEEELTAADIRTESEPVTIPAQNSAMKQSETKGTAAAQTKEQNDLTEAAPADEEAGVKMIEEPVEMPKKENDSEVREASGMSAAEEEVVFAGHPLAASGTAEGRKKAKHSKAEPKDEEEIVFAVVDPNAQKARRASSKRRKRFPVLPVVMSAAVLAVGAGVAALTMSFINSRDAQQTFSETGGSVSTATGEGQKTEESELKEIPDDIPVEPVDVDTTNILFGENVTVEGVNLAGKTLTQAHQAMQDRLTELRENISITIVCDGKTLTLTQDDFEFDSNLAGVLLQAYHYSRGEIDKPTVDNIYRNGVTDFKVVTRLNTESVDKAIEKAENFYNVQPVDAHVVKFDPMVEEKFTYQNGSDGFLVDHDELSQNIRLILRKDQKSGSFSIQTHQTPFKITLEDIKANTSLIASHYTTAANVYNSVHNMELALLAANGTVVGPGEQFSFNGMTGNTTNGDEHHYANGVTGGYLPSTAYAHGEIVQDYGGGICQASTTIYNCALKAGMKVVDRYPHMYASSYAAYGLDATVDYGNLDMCFENPTEYPIYIATYVYDFNGDGYDELMVEIYGPISEEYDEIVAIGWVTEADTDCFYHSSAQVYFKDGKEVKRVRLPGGRYDYHYESYYTVAAQVPADVRNGPAAYPTYSTPTVYAPMGCGSNGPIAYGTAAQVLAKARGTTAPTTSTTAKPTQNAKPDQSSGSYVTVVSKPVEEPSEETSEVPAGETSQEETAGASDTASEQTQEEASQAPAEEISAEENSQSQ